MSISNKLEAFSNSSRIVINDNFFGNPGAFQLANFLTRHQRVVSLEIKSDDIHAQGFISIFQALLRNPNLKQLNIQHNNLGSNDIVQWHDALNNLIQSSQKLERLNISNNKISGEGFSKILYSVVCSKSLKLFQARYNNIDSQPIQEFANLLKRQSNENLLYVQFAGNKYKKQAIQAIQSVLSKNRKNNPITKQKLLGNVNYSDQLADNQQSRRIVRDNSLASVSQDQMILYLQDILDQNRYEASQNKLKLQRQLQQLQKQEKMDTAQLNQLEKKCGEMVILNRNLKFQLDRTLGQFQQIQRDQQSHLRAHEDSVRQINKQIQDLQTKYQDTENRMNKQHELKMKQTVRNWEQRLRSVQQKIRMTENDNIMMENQIKKQLDKRERLKLQLVDQQTTSKIRIQTEEENIISIKFKELESKLKQILDNRDGHINRNQELVYQLEKCHQQNKKQIQELQLDLQELKQKEKEFNAKSKDFFTKNEKIKSQIQLKQITINKLKEQVQNLDKQIELKRKNQIQQISRLKNSYIQSKVSKKQNKNNRAKKLSQVQNSLRLAQLQCAKLRQQYALLAQKLQINISFAVHSVFQDNSLI